MRQDIHRMAGCMDSIEEGVIYFKGFVDRYAERVKANEERGRVGHKRGSLV